MVQGITEYGADTADEILELLHRGNLHRTVEPTAANQVSSRSHAVLQVTVEQAERTAHVTGQLRIGKLSMVDLAGSERASKTENRGERLKEGANINRSLLALGNCITALAEGRRRNGRERHTRAQCHTPVALTPVALTPVASRPVRTQTRTPPALGAARMAVALF